MRRFCGGPNVNSAVWATMVQPQEGPQASVVAGGVLENGILSREEGRAKTFNSTDFKEANPRLAGTAKL